MTLWGKALATQADLNSILRIYTEKGKTQFLVP